MKKVFFSALAVSAVAIPSQAAVDKIGVVDLQEVVMLLPKFKKASADFEAFSKVMQDEFKLKVEKLQKQFEALPKDDAHMTEAQKAEKQAIFAQVQKLDEDMKSRTESKQQSLVKPIFDEINNAMKQVRKEEGYTIIVNSTSLLDFDPSCNLSDKVLKKLGIADPAAARKQLQEKNSANNAGAKTSAVAKKK